MTDEQITKAARAICVEQSSKQDNGDWQIYASGGWDHTIWMRLVEAGIRKGMETCHSSEEAREDECNKIADWFLKHNLRQLADEIRTKEYYK